MPTTAAISATLLDSAAAANPVIQAPSAPTLRLPDSPVNAATLERFRSLLAGAQPPSANPSAAPASAAMAAADTERSSIANRILDGIERTASATDAKMQYVETGLRTDGDSLQDLMRIQAALLSWTYQTELVTKAVSKGTQDLDQLLKQT